jgi:hypothetical protein
MPDRSDYKHLYDTGHWQRRRALQLQFSGKNHRASNGAADSFLSR